MPKAKMSDENLRMFSMNMKNLRTEAGLSATEFSELVGKSPEYIRNIERGSDRPSLKLAAVIADAFGVPLDAMYLPEAERKASSRAVVGRDYMKRRIDKNLTIGVVAGALGTTREVYKSFERGECTLAESQMTILDCLLGEDTPPTVTETVEVVKTVKETIPDEIVDVILKHVTDLQVSTDIQKQVFRYFSEAQIANAERKLFG